MAQVERDYSRAVYKSCPDCGTATWHFRGEIALLRGAYHLVCEKEEEHGRREEAATQDGA